MSFEIVAMCGRTIDYAGTIYEADEATAVVASAGSKLRFKAGRRHNAMPVLDLDDIGAASGGSIATYDETTGAYTLKIAGSDTAGLRPGVYDAEIAVVDAGDLNRIKVAERGTLLLLESLGGDIDET